MKLLPRSSLLALGALALFGCGSDGVATLSGTIASPTLAVERSALAADVTGGFELVLELGEFAAGPTEVSLGSFALERDDTVLLPALSLSGGMFPATVGAGQSRRFRMTFDQEAELSEADALCAGPLMVRGSVSDSLAKNRPTTLRSTELTATCTGP